MNWDDKATEATPRGLGKRCSGLPLAVGVDGGLLDAGSDVPPFDQHAPEKPAAAVTVLAASGRRGPASIPAWFRTQRAGSFRCRCGTASESVQSAAFSGLGFVLHF